MVTGGRRLGERLCEGLGGMGIGDGCDSVRGCERQMRGWWLQAAWLAGDFSYVYIGMATWYTGMHAVTGVRWDGVCQMRVVPCVA